MLGAGISFSLAFVIIIAAGLPDPAVLLALTPVLPDEQPVAPVRGAAAPVFSAVDAAGHGISLLDLRGGSVVLNFWATWCVPCAVEMPDLQALWETHRDNGPRVLAVNVDEPPARFVLWAAARGLTFDLLPDPDRAIQTLYGLRGVPQTVVIDPAGIIRDVFYGPVSFDRLNAVLDDPP